jgi:hypothetical protein
VPLEQQADRILKVAGPDDSERLDWPAIEKALTDRQGYPIRITEPLEPLPQAEAAPEPAQAAQPAAAPEPAQNAPPAQSAQSPAPPVPVGALRFQIESVPPR